MTSCAVTHLLALDIDGTLLTREYRLPCETRDAVKRARQHGVIVALATARSPAGVTTVLFDLGDVDYAVCLGGSLILRRVDGAWVNALAKVNGMVLTRDVLVQIFAACHELGLSFAAFTESEAFIEALDPLLAKEFGLTNDPYVAGRVEENDAPVFKVLAISDMAETEKLDRLANVLGSEVSAAKSHVNYLEIGPRGATKGSGLAVLAASLGLSAKDAAAIGDGENDLPMFAWAGTAIAMGNAPASVQAACTWTTASCEEAGVALAIDRLLAERWVSQENALGEVHKS